MIPTESPISNYHGDLFKDENEKNLKSEDGEVEKMIGDNDNDVGGIPNCPSLTSPFNPIHQSPRHFHFLLHHL